MKIPENPTTDDIYMLLGSRKYSRFITTLTDNVYDRKKYILEDIVKLVNQSILPDRTDCRMMDATMGIEYGMSTGRLNPDVYSWLMSLSMKDFIALILEISKICTTVGSVPFYLNRIQVKRIEQEQKITYKRVKAPQYVYKFRETVCLIGGDSPCKIVKRQMEEGLPMYHVRTVSGKVMHLREWEIERPNPIRFL